MPIQISFEHQNKLGVAQYEGEISPGDLTEYVSRWQSREFMEYDELVVVCANVKALHGDLLEHARRVMNLDAFFEFRRRTAIVAATERSVHFAEFWMTTYGLATSNPKNRQIEIFGSTDEARDWLNSARHA